MPGSGVNYSPEFEVVLAAHWRGYKDEEFDRLSGDKQARIVAAYRLYVKMNAVVELERVREAKRNAALTRSAG